MTRRHIKTTHIRRISIKWILPVCLSLCVTTSTALAVPVSLVTTLSWWLLVQAFLFAVVLLLACYSIRHYFFTCQRLYGTQLHLHGGIFHAPWPNIVIFVAAHNEETVIGDALNALMEADYPEDCIKVVPVNDRSTDNTRNVIESVVAQYPDRIQAFHRTSGKPQR
jgi:cellulose synthase/poly-beta-1,6-N-acetylglucosamine synthase-like glycosyltransferase